MNDLVVRVCSAIFETYSEKLGENVFRTMLVFYKLYFIDYVEEYIGNWINLARILIYRRIIKYINNFVPSSFFGFCAFCTCFHLLNCFKCRLDSRVFFWLKENEVFFLKTQGKYHVFCNKFLGKSTYIFQNSGWIFSSSTNPGCVSVRNINFELWNTLLVYRDQKRLCPHA